MELKVLLLFLFVIVNVSGAANTGVMVGYSPPPHTFFADYVYFYMLANIARKPTLVPQGSSVIVHWSELAGLKLKFCISLRWTALFSIKICSRLL